MAVCVSFGAGGAPTFVGPDFLIGAAAGGVHGERGAAVAYSTVSKRFLVAYHQYGGGGQPGNDIRGQLVSDTGQLVGGPINISFDNHFQGEVGVGYSPASDKFLVAYRQLLRAGRAGDDPDPDGQRRQRRARHRGRHRRCRATSNVPEVTYNTKNNQFLLGLVAGHRRGRRSTTDACMNPDGAPAGNPTPLIVNYGGYDSLGIDYNVRADTYLRGRPRPRAGDVPAGRRRRRDLGRRCAERRVRRDRHGQQARQLQPAHRREHGAQRVDDGDVHRRSRRQRAAHQDAGQRRRAAAAAAAPAAADRC